MPVRVIPEIDRLIKLVQEDAEKFEELQRQVSDQTIQLLKHLDLFISTS